MGQYAHTVVGLRDQIRKDLAAILRESENLSFTDTHSLAEHLHPQAHLDAETAEAAKIHYDLEHGKLPQPRPLDAR